MERISSIRRRQLAQPNVLPPSPMPPPPPLQLPPLTPRSTPPSALAFGRPRHRTSCPFRTTALCAAMVVAGAPTRSPAPHFRRTRQQRCATVPCCTPCSLGAASRSCAFRSRSTYDDASWDACGSPHFCWCVYTVRCQL
uniref:Uncharacterized protein n=1 Tax=Haptolina brevifila TaxID=156173 RepID=A0A7S2DGX5_9EUKA